ncbi:MAG: DUF3800 domain-containing protein [Candidatus Omnitrophica bacterium]|nr:DUF3800 domain-containing protein [Candidatus Omnitrophota bacterium]
MLFFLDESWQTSNDEKRQAGVLSAISIKSHDFNKCSTDIFNIKVKHIGYDAAKLELKGRGILKPYFFKQLQEKGIESVQLNLAEAILKYTASMKAATFASIVYDKQELNLSCAEEDRLERPFFFLFERINQFMNENHPELIAKLIFDDRGLETNQRISKAVSNFFHKSRTGQSFDKILKVPFFAMSNDNVGIQLADISAYILGRVFTGDGKLKKYHLLIKSMEFKSREELTAPDGKKHRLFGFKIIKNKEAGGL